MPIYVFKYKFSSDSTAKMRCRQRKHLFQRRNKICDLSLILGLLGLILVVIDTELTAQRIVSKVGKKGFRHSSKFSDFSSL